MYIIDSITKEAVKVNAVPLAERSGHVQEQARLAAEKASQEAVVKAREEFRKDTSVSGGSLFSDTKAKNERRQAVEKESGSIFSMVKKFFKW